MPATSIQVSIRMKPEDYALIKRNAVGAGVSVSAWIISQSKKAQEAGK